MSIETTKHVDQPVLSKAGEELTVLMPNDAAKPALKKPAGSNGHGSPIGDTQVHAMVRGNRLSCQPAGTPCRPGAGTPDHPQDKRVAGRYPFERGSTQAAEQSVRLGAGRHHPRALDGFIVML